MGHNIHTNICKALRVLITHGSLTNWQIREKAKIATDIQSLHGIISKATGNNGLIKVAGLLVCENCGSKHKTYQPTEKGREYLERIDKVRANVL